MYEVRQNKEKVSRRIDGGRSRQVMNKENLRKSKNTDMVLQRNFSFSLRKLSNQEILFLIRTLIANLIEDNVLSRIENMRRSVEKYYISIQSIIQELYPELDIKSVNDKIIKNQIESLASKNPNSERLYRRTDTRSLNDLEVYKGFFAKSPMSLEHARLLVKKLYTKDESPDAKMFEFNVTHGEREYCVCTSFFDKEYTYGTGINYIISLPSNFIKREPENSLNIPKEQLIDMKGQPYLYMDSDNIDNATIIGLAPSNEHDVELTFLTGIPMRFISEDKTEIQDKTEELPTETLDKPTLLSPPPPPPPPPPPTNRRK